MFADSFSDEPFDVTVKDLPERRTNKRIATLRTSDRISFRSCRRQWGWGSHLRGNLGSKFPSSPLWLGSGFHFAMEDFHGLNLYETPARALDAYYYATRRKGGSDNLPATWREDLQLGRDMLRYYTEDWLATRDPLQTFVYKDEPQVEVNFRLLVPFDTDLMLEWGYDEVVYSGTLDRVITDEYGTLYIVEYKTAKQIFTKHFQTDPQVTAYCWAASVLYPGHAIGGVIYQQHRKSLPDEPRMLASGKLSTNKSQNTTHSRYRKAVNAIYGDPSKAPADVVSCMSELARQENELYDDYVRRDYLFRNSHQIQAEGEKVLLECLDMLNPDLNLYPNPTRMNCAWCAFQGPCIGMDSGEDWEDELKAFTTYREATYDSWRKFLPDPDSMKEDPTNG